MARKRNALPTLTQQGLSHMFAASEADLGLYCGAEDESPQFFKSLRDRHQKNQLVRRRGRLYVINKTNKRFKATRLIGLYPPKPYGGADLFFVTR